VTRARVDDVLRPVRASAYPPGGFVGQEGFTGAGEVVDLARRAGVGPGVRVLDVCCGAGGPGRLVVRELGCRYVGVDVSPAAVRMARERAGDLDCRYVLAEVPPLPPGEFDVVLLLETLLAFPDKARLLAAVSAALVPGGRFACTVEAGAPLTPAERALMPDADTVWPVPEPALLAGLERAGLQVRELADVTRSHLEVVDALLVAFAAHQRDVERQLGPGALDALVAGHRLWRTWLADGRVRKLAVVAQRAAAPA
jgi:sarcosine/dimethylglycine N-methyltransferase